MRKGTMTKKQIEDAKINFPNLENLFKDDLEKRPHVDMKHLSNSRQDINQLIKYIRILFNYINRIIKHGNYYLINIKFKTSWSIDSIDSIKELHIFMKNKWKIFKCLYDCYYTELIIIQLILANTNKNNKKCINYKKRIKELEKSIDYCKDALNDTREKANELCTEIEEKARGVESPTLSCDV